MEREKEWGRKKDYEVIVKNEIADNILDILIYDAINDIKRIDIKKNGF